MNYKLYFVKYNNCLNIKNMYNYIPRKYIMLVIYSNYNIYIMIF